MRMWLLTGRTLAAKQSVVRVIAGERLTEFAALEALLIPFRQQHRRDARPRWDAGSVAGFVDKMNQARGQAPPEAHDVSLTLPGSPFRP